MASMVPRPTLIGLDRTGLKRALALAFAAWLSFAIASLLHVGNAYWAAMPVWVLTQPSRGLVFERAIYRVLGTLIGAGAGLAVVALELPGVAQVVLLSLWIAAMAGLTHLLRGVSGYAALLAGMTAAIVVLPDLFAPQGAATVALARVECTLIGVVVSTLVLAWLTPGSELRSLYAEARMLAVDAVSFAARELERTDDAEGEAKAVAEEGRLVGRIGLLEASARLASAGSRDAYRKLSALEHLVVGMLASMAAARALRLSQRAVRGTLGERLGQFATALRDDAPLPLPLADGRRNDGKPDHLHRAVEQIREALAGLAAPSETASPGAARSVRLAPHREWPLAWRAAGLAGGACLFVTLAGLWLPWASMHLVALGACVFGMLLSSLPQPQQIAPKLVAGVTAGVVVAVVYRLLVQPGIGSTAELLLSLIPFLVAGGLARAHPRTSIAGIDANMCFLLASQAGVAGDAAASAVLADAVALVLPAAAFGALFMWRPRRAERMAQDAARAIRRDLCRILQDGGRVPAADWQARGMRQILRLTLHLGRAGAAARHAPGSVIAALNVGQSLLDLRRAGLAPPVYALLLDGLSQHAAPRAVAAALRDIAAGDDDAGRRDILRELAGHLERAEGVLVFRAGNPH